MVKCGKCVYLYLGCGKWKAKKLGLACNKNHYVKLHCLGLVKDCECTKTGSADMW